VRPHAELAEVWPRDGLLRLVGSLHGHLHGRAPADEPPTGWWLLAQLRDGGPGDRLHYPAPLRGPAFDVSLPVADLAPEGPALPIRWDLYLTPERGPRPEQLLRVGRLLDDIKGKKHIMILPAQPVARGTGPARVRPYYTIKDNLSVEVKADS
jgi:hypothetical protein